MTAFVLVAVGLAVLAAASVVLPLLLAAGPGPRAQRTAALVVALVIGVAGAAYLARSNWNWSNPPAADRTDLTELAQRARSAPGDRDAWLHLGQTYVQAGQLPLALRAFEHVNGLANGKDPEALAGLGEALLLAGDESGAATAADMFERALALDPHSPRALFYSGLLAMNAGHLEVARTRFGALLELDPPEQVRTALTGQIATIDRMLHPPVDAGTLIDVQIDVTDALRARLPAQGTLFVFVRDPGGGAPLAVRRLGPALPVHVQLSALDAMAGPAAFGAGQVVNVVARISVSGQPQAGSGDLYGELRYRAGKDGLKHLTIDKALP